MAIERQSGVVASIISIACVAIYMGGGIGARVACASDDADSPPRAIGSSAPRRNAGERRRRSRAAEAPRRAGRTSGASGNVVCDACDGNHKTADCPHFRGRKRDNHPDALRRKKGLLAATGEDARPYVVRSATVVRQPGDNSCLFHSIAHQLPGASMNARSLRRSIVAWIQQHPSFEIADSALSEWILWDGGGSVRRYCARMARMSSWGGGIEMAACSQLKKINIWVYEKARRGGYKRIGVFDYVASNGGRRSATTVHVLYSGGVHFDVLVPRMSSVVRGSAL